MGAEIWRLLADAAIASTYDLAPVLALLALFQVAVVRERVARPARLAAGLAYLALGLTLFRVGLAESVIPMGGDMARHLLALAVAQEAGARSYLPLLAFAALIAFAATLVEPTLSAVGKRVQEMSGGVLRSRALRLTIATGMAAGLVLGTARIVLGIPLGHLIAAMVTLLVVLALLAPREMIPLALDSGGVATSVVTVPLIAAYGLALAQAWPRASSLADGFGLIVLGLLGSAVVLLATACILDRMRARSGGSDAV